MALECPNEPLWAQKVFSAVLPAPSAEARSFSFLCQMAVGQARIAVYLLTAGLLINSPST